VKTSITLPSIFPAALDRALTNIRATTRGDYEVVVVSPFRVVVNVVRYKGRFYCAPQQLGPLDLRIEADRTKEGIQTCRKIAKARSMAAKLSTKLGSSPVKSESQSSLRWWEALRPRIRHSRFWHYN
jgi:hypothetical protein